MKRAKDHLALARQYEDDVLSGAVAACKWIRLACERNRRDQGRADAADPAFPYRFNEKAARRICQFAELLPHVKGPKAKIVGRDESNRPIYATIELEPWQCWFLATLFGWLQLDELRRFRIALMLVPRKNAKSTIGAIIVLYMLTMDDESGAECYSAATTRDQAKVVAEIAWHMAKRSPQFCEQFGVRVGSETTFTLSVPGTASKFGPLSADAQTLDALNVSLAVIDELHAHKTRGVWDVLDTATGARLQPMLFAPTTAGIDIGGIAYEKLSYLQKVLTGVLTDEQFFGVNYTVDDGDDISDVAVQRKANPNYGVSVSASDLARKLREAQQTPAAMSNVLTKHFNVWVRTESAYVPVRELMAAGNRQLKIEDFKDAPCWIGVDLSEIRDFAATVALFRPDPARYVAFCRLYLPASAVGRSPIAQMSGWVREGFVIETEGNQADYLRIEDDIVEWCDLLTDVREIDFDRALAAQMSQNLKRRFLSRMGKDAVERFVVTVPQSIETMNPALQMVNGLILSEHFLHEANQTFVWMFSNVVVERNHKGEVYPRKAGGKDSHNNIDGPMACYTAFNRAAQSTIGPKRKRKGALVYTPGGFVPAIPPPPPAGAGVGLSVR